MIKIVTVEDLQFLLSPWRQHYSFNRQLHVAFVIAHAKWDFSAQCYNWLKFYLPLFHWDFRDKDIIKNCTLNVCHKAYGVCMQKVIIQCKLIIPKFCGGFMTRSGIPRFMKTVRYKQFLVTVLTHLRQLNAYPTTKIPSYIKQQLKARSRQNDAWLIYRCPTGVFNVPEL